ncbi:MAG: hypothetical protein Ct9H300mP21_01750 [Pseudomonadota bacterium]|nr:MAG: hypothetical protein Ct9H300mP21_01750 [Pseudomonadota bacterium]
MVFFTWFRRQTLDYSFGDSTTRTLPNGLYETEVNVKKLDLLKCPLVVSLIKKDGKQIGRLVPGIKQQETVVFKTRVFRIKFHLIQKNDCWRHRGSIIILKIFYRVRFGFDWKKHREHLVLLFPGFGEQCLRWKFCWFRNKIRV